MMRDRTSSATWRALAAGVLVFMLVSCGADDPSTPSSGSSTTGSVGSNTTPSSGRTSVDATGEGTGSFPWTGDPKRDGSLRAVHIRAREVAQPERQGAGWRNDGQRPGLIYLS